jgi:hypothetical protein
MSTAATVVQSNLMNAMAVDHDKSIVIGFFRQTTSFVVRMPQLNSKAERFEGNTLKKSIVPDL